MTTAPMHVAEPRESVASSAWPDAVVDVTVVVATHNRRHWLPDLIAAVSAQTAAVELVVADDGSTDGTWDWLQSYAASAASPVLALRLPHTGGPSVPRNTAASLARTPVLAVTDDDCLPEPGWAAALAKALDDGVAVVQGATRPAGGEHGPWARTVSVQEPSGLYETCNIGFRRDAFVGVGGFPLFDVLADLPRGFGEDVVLGARLARDGGFAWAPDAVVQHRWVPGDYRAHLAGVRRLSGFAWLAREVPELVDRFPGGVFLSRRTAEFDAAVAGVAAAVLLHRPLLAATALPWAARRLRSARGRPGRPVAMRFAQEAYADSVGLVSLLHGSVRHRRLVL